MAEQIRKASIKPAYITSFRTSPVHKIERPPGVILPLQSPVYGLYRILSNRAGVQAAITYG